MINIANFSSVFEICFALNFLLYFFEIRPVQHKRHKEQIEEYAKKINTTYKEAKSIFFVLTFAQYFSIFFATIFSIFNSTICLTLLIWSGFDPLTKVSITSMTVLLIWLIVFPLVSYIVFVMRKGEFYL